ncbi:MAG TPA: HDIG domain-containing protein [Chloroflexi bacterium]|nr:HDIG domain-containing protein [Chloroflexota bacterium]
MSGLTPPTASPASASIHPSAKAWRLRRALLALLMLAAVAGIMWLSTAEDNLALHAGEVAPRDILAPYSHTYESAVLTEKRREAAAQAVSKVYAPPDASIGRRQLERLRAALTFITAVRADPYATQQQKLADLAAIQGLHLSASEARYLLTLDDERWQNIQQEAQRVLETMMRAPIREDQLEEARRNIPAFITLTMPERQADLVERLVEAFLAPNSLYSASLTEAAREKAREAVPPVVRAFRRGETIVQRGQVLTPEDIEALKEYGLLQGTARWQAILAPLLLVLIAFLVLAAYIRLRRPMLGENITALTIAGGLGILFLVGARITIPGHIVLPYVYPFAAYPLVMFLLFDAESALVFLLPLLALGLYHLPHGFELMTYHAFLGIAGVVLLSQVQRMRTFFLASAGMALTGGTVLLATRLASPSTDLPGMITLLGAAATNGVLASSLALVLHYFLAPPLGQITPIQLLELSRPDQPLLQELLQKAPGTYQHSLQVANLAEQAARAVHADALLVRVGALYHDIGKVLRPQFFIENQPPGSTNPHERLSPEESARIIIAHVSDGLALAKEHRLPRRIQDFIAEHHGTLITRYQYARAVQEAGGDANKVDIEHFRYPGPRPQSKETALVMLADGCEARARAEHPPDKHELRRLVHDTITTRIREGQLSDTQLTLHDLKTIEDTFVAALQGVYHPRIQYPQLQENRGQATIPASEARALATGDPEPPATEDAEASPPPENDDHAHHSSDD